MRTNSLAKTIWVQLLLCGWLHSSPITEIIDSNPNLPPASPANVAVNSKGEFFITNAGPISSNSAPLVGWIYSPSNGKLTEIYSDISTSFSSAVPFNVAVNSKDEFFITNFSGISSSSAPLVGWTYPSSNGTATEILSDITTNFTSAAPREVAVNSKDEFFITNSDAISSSSAPLVGWTYPSSNGTATEILSDTTTSFTFALPQFVTANNKGEFFIVSSSTISTGGLVGWTYLSSNGTATEILSDTTTSFTSATPYSVAANSKDEFFITNSDSISSSSAPLVGWTYLSSNGTATEILSDTTTTFTATQAQYVAVNNKDEFFITCSDSISSNNAPLIGWTYPSSNGTATEIFSDTSFQSGIPNEIAVNSKSEFFITNYGPISSSSGPLVGWTYSSSNPTAASIFSETRTSFTSAFPNNIAVNSKDEFFIANLNRNSNLVGWTYTSGKIATEIIDSKPLSTTGVPNIVAVNNQGAFVITNGTGVLSPETPITGGLVGWIYNSSTSTRAFQRPSGRR